MCWPNPRTAICPVTWVLNIGPDLFGRKAIEMRLGRSMFSACGPYVRKIVMRNVPAEKAKARAKAKDFSEQFKSHVFQYCRNVEELVFVAHTAPLTKWGTASSFFREYAATLRSIDWRGEEDEKGFSDLRECKNISRLISGNFSSATLISLLQTCGPTLEKLYISIEPIGESAEVV